MPAESPLIAHDADPDEIAALAAMLVYTGVRLASPREFINVFRIGPDQLLIFVATILGVLVVVASIGLFIGMTYLILATNTGARLGFLITAAALSGMMLLLSSLWWTTASPLNTLKGRVPHWVPVESIQGKGFLLGLRTRPKAAAVRDALLAREIVTGAQRAYRPGFFRGLRDAGSGERRQRERKCAERQREVPARFFAEARKKSRHARRREATDRRVFHPRF